MGRMGHGLFVTECVWPGRVVAKYRGTLTTHLRVEEETKRRAQAGQHEEYQMSVEGADVIIDAMHASCDAKYAKHSCKPNARYATSVSGVTLMWCSLRHW